MNTNFRQQRLTPSQLSTFQGKGCYEIILEKYIGTLQNSSWRELVLTFHEMKTPLSDYRYPLLSNWKYQEAPGSGAHHMHFGGLALHTLQDLEYADSWACVYEQRGIAINHDLLYATILLHDCMKRFIYKFDESYQFTKSEDPFIAKQEDHHSWVLRELTHRGCDKELILSVAAIHGIDDVSLKSGVNSVAVVNHYLMIGDTHLVYTPDDIRPEHVIAFLSDSDWFWSGRAQVKAAILAEQLAAAPGELANYLKVVLGSRFTYEYVGHYVERYGFAIAVPFFEAQLNA